MPDDHPIKINYFIIIIRISDSFWTLSIQIFTLTFDIFLGHACIECNALLNVYWLILCLKTAYYSVPRHIESKIEKITIRLFQS